jgi:hypothetical protein
MTAGRPIGAVSSIIATAGSKADSTGRRTAVLFDFCEALVKRLGRRSPDQRLVWSTIQARCNRRDHISAMRTEVGAFGEVLAQQPLGILIGAALPRALGATKIDLHTCIDLETGVLRHLCALTPDE